MYRIDRLFAALLLGALWSSAPAGANDFVADVVRVSDAASSIKDPEFDNLGYRMVWQDTDKNLWVADVDPLNGDVYPPSGKGQLLDTGLYPFAKNANGPEWAFGNGKANIVYVKDFGGLPVLKAARIDSAGAWTTITLGNPLSRYQPLGTSYSNTGTPMAVYLVNAADGSKQTAWRNLYNAASEKFTPASARGGRFVEGGSGILTMATFGGPLQVAMINPDDGSLTQLTFDSGQKASPFMWWDPTLGEYLLLTVVDSTVLAIYREGNGRWERYNTIQSVIANPAGGIPSRFQYLTSPEILVFNDQSYFAIVIAERLEDKGPLDHWPAGMTEIWLGSVHPSAAPFYRRVDDSTRDGHRTEPEFLMTELGPIVYYSEVEEVTGLTQLYRASTGLQ